MLDDNYKFSAITFEKFNHNIIDEFQIEDLLQISPNNPVDFPNHWADWLGTLESKSIISANLSITKKQRSQRLGILDNENKQLTRFIESYTHSLWIYDVPYYKAAYVFSGSKENGEFSIRQIYKENRYFKNTYLPSHSYTKTDFIKCKEMADTLLTLSSNDEFSRFKRGLFAFFKAIGERNGEFRFHQFIRALEALIIPEIGKTKRQFINRCRTFIKCDQDTDRFLEEIYDIRSDIEHLHSLRSSIQKFHKNQAEDYLQLRSRQIEHLARDTYKFILNNQDILEIFRNDESINSYWHTSDNDRSQAWNNKVDIKKYAQGVFEL